MKPVVNPIRIMDLPEQIKKLRAGRRVTDLAPKAGISPPTWYNLEGSYVNNTTIETLYKIADVLDCELVIKLKPKGG